MRACTSGERLLLGLGSTGLSRRSRDAMRPAISSAAADSSMGATIWPLLPLVLSALAQAVASSEPTSCPVCTPQA